MPEVNTRSTNIPETWVYFIENVSYICPQEGSTKHKLSNIS